MTDTPDVASVESTPAAVEIPVVTPFTINAVTTFLLAVATDHPSPHDSRARIAYELAAAIVVRDMADARYRHRRAIETVALRVAEPKHTEVRLKEAIDARPEFLLWKQARADAAAWVAFYGGLLGQQPAVLE